MRKILVCFGDSFTKGKVLDPKDKDFRMIEENFPALLGKKLLDFKIINAGVNDNTTIDALVRINSDVLSKKATHVVILFGGNDVRIDWFRLVINKFKNPKSKVSIKDFKVNLKKIANLCKKNKIVPIFMTLPPMDIDKFLNRLNSMFGSRLVEGIKKHNGVKRIANGYNKYSDMIKKITKEQSLPVIYLREIFLKQKNWSSLISEDGVHPSSRGHRFIAKVILDSKLLLTL